MSGTHASHLCRALSLIAALVLAPQASATFHLWQIREIYSDASGTVQYVELATSAGGQQFLAGHDVSATQGGSTHSFIIPSNLPGDSADRTFLIGTPGFASLNLVTPDYIMPSGFLFQPGGSVNFAGVDAVSYTSLPTDGIHGLDRNGNSVVNAPTNFAGASASILRNAAALDCLFNWAERNFASLASPPAASQVLLPYYYRFYAASNIYVGASVADNHLYDLDAAGLHDLGQQAGWLATAGCN